MKNKFELVLELCAVDLHYGEDGIECVHWNENLNRGLIDEALINLSKVHAVIFCKIIWSLVEVGKLQQKMDFILLWVKHCGYDPVIFTFIEELSEKLPITINYSEKGPIVRCETNYLSALLGNREFNVDFDNKPFIEVLALFHSFYSSFRRRTISLSYFKRFLRQRIMIVNNIELSHKLQFFTIHERFVYFLLSYLGFRNKTKSIYLCENKLYYELNLLGFDFTSFSSNFLDVVDIIYDKDGQLEGFSLNEIMKLDAPNVISGEVDKTLRIINYDLFAAHGPGFLKMGVVCKKDTFIKIIDMINDKRLKFFHVRLTRFLLLQEELSEAFLKSIIIDIKSFVDTTYSCSRLFVVLSDFEAVFRFAKNEQLDYLYHFANELFSLSFRNTTLIVKTNDYDLYDTDIDYHIENDDEDYSLEALLQSAAERDELLNSFKKI